MTNKAATASMLKQLNERTVFEAIRAGAPISRAEVSRQVGISKPTVSAALENLLDAGLVRQTSAAADGPTYGALFFEPVTEAAHVLGLDIGARYLRGVLAVLDGTVRQREDVDIQGADITTVVAEAVKLRDRLAKQAGIDASSVEVAVVGVPGIVGADGLINEGGSVEALDGFPLGEAMADALGVRVIAENDINLAALGEQWRGVGRDVDDFVFLSIGTGSGAGMVLRSELYRGYAGAAGEIDFALESGRDASPYDPCAVALTTLAQEWLNRTSEKTKLKAPLDPERIFGVARDGDKFAGRIVAEEARRIAVYAAPIVAVLNVELIVLGGGIGLNGDLLLEPVSAELAQRVPYPPRLECSSLGEAAVLTGALAVGTRVALESVIVRRLG